MTNNYCPNCGNKILSNDNFCSKCGTKTKPDEPTESTILIQIISEKWSPLWESDDIEHGILDTIKELNSMLLLWILSTSKLAVQCNVHTEETFESLQNHLVESTTLISLTAFEVGLESCYLESQGDIESSKKCNFFNNLELINTISKPISTYMGAFANDVFSNRKFVKLASKKLNINSKDELLNVYSNLFTKIIISIFDFGSETLRKNPIIVQYRLE